MRHRPKSRPVILKGRCAGCGAECYTAYCDTCTSDTITPARFFRQCDSESTQRQNGHVIAHKIVRGGGE